MSQTFSLHNSVVPAESGMLEKGGQVPPTRFWQKQKQKPPIILCSPDFQTFRRESLNQKSRERISYGYHGNGHREESKIERHIVSAI